MIRHRMGRLIAFLAKERQAGLRSIAGLGVDERASLVVEGDGTARLMAPPGTYGWLVQPVGQPQRAVLGQPLDYAAVRITGIGPESRLDLATLSVTRPAFAGTARVERGSFACPCPRPALKRPIHKQNTLFPHRRKGQHCPPPTE
jgi:beta-aspartyl-peptidase (threonine type)